MSQTIAAHLASLLGNNACVGQAEITDTGGLWPEESAAISHAVPKRQAEFAAGRRAARQALSGIGIAKAPLPVGSQREPVWPQGIVGAITHDAGLALAAVMQDDQALGLGIDLTEAVALPGETRRVILPRKIEQGLDPLEERAVFSAKESLFKALFPTIGSHFGFDAAIVVPNLAEGHFRISLTKALGPFEEAAEWSGRMVVHDGLIVTALVIQRP